MPTMNCANKAWLLKNVQISPSLRALIAPPFRLPSLARIPLGLLLQMLLL
jgi:hypothetical protein